MIDVDALVHAADLDRLTDAIDHLADAGDWDTLLELRHACRAALSTGRQLWPSSTYATFRLALDAPVAIAASTLQWADEDRYTPGPLPEILASRHDWVDLRPHLPESIEALTVAEELVARGAAIDPIEVPFGEACELPMRLSAWEPAYPAPVYKRTGPQSPAPAVDAVFVRGRSAEVAQPAPDAAAGAAALRDALRHWEQSSSGRVVTVGVSGGSDLAVRSLGVTSFEIAPIETAEAFALLAWGAADGAAEGRRRGLSWARRAVWWSVAAMLGVDEEIDDVDLVDGSVRALTSFVWRTHEPMMGWTVRLAFEDLDEGFAWALSAVDERLTPNA